MTKLHKLLFTSTLILGTMMAMSSYSWVGMWMGLEINLLSIIPLMNSSKNQLSSESSLKYFITQTIASSVLLYALILTSIKNLNNDWTLEYHSTFITLSLMLKMGAAPLHFWFPEIMEGLSWINALIMMTWQKIAPLTILINSPKNINFLYLCIVASLTIGGLMGFNQSSLRKILAYSSINHVGWMLGAIISSSSIWMNYFLIYSFITLSLVLILKKYNIFHIKQIFSLKKNLIKISCLSNFLSMGGVPPFLGFLPKWMTLSVLTKTNPSLALSMVIITLITLFFYLRTLIPSLTLTNAEVKIHYSAQPNPLIWLINGLNITALALCTLWFNLT